MTIQERIEKLMKEHPDLFPTESSFWTYLRGCLRRGLWERSPMKHIKSQRGASKPPAEYVGRAKKGAVCALTGEWTPISKMEVDHIKGHMSLKVEEDIIPYIIHLLASGDELQLVNKEAHKIKSYADANKLTFEEAVIEKKVIAFTKLPAKDQIEILDKYGVQCNNAKIRKDEYRKILKGETQ